MISIYLRRVVHDRWLLSFILSYATECIDLIHYKMSKRAADAEATVDAVESPKKKQRGRPPKSKETTKSLVLDATPPPSSPGGGVNVSSAQSPVTPSQPSLGATGGNDPRISSFWMMLTHWCFAGPTSSAAVVFNGINNFVNSVTSTGASSNAATMLVAKCFTDLRHNYVDLKLSSGNRCYKGHVECVDPYGVPFLLEFWHDDLDDGLKNVEHAKHPMPYLPGSVLLLDMKYGTKSELNSKHYGVPKLIQRGFKFKVTPKKKKNPGDSPLAKHWRRKCSDPGYRKWGHKAEFEALHGDPSKFPFTALPVDGEPDDASEFSKSSST